MKLAETIHHKHIVTETGDIVTISSGPNRTDARPRRYATCRIVGDTATWIGDFKPAAMHCEAVDKVNGFPLIHVFAGDVIYDSVKSPRSKSS